MALRVDINGVDKTSLVLWRTLVWSQTLTSEVDTLNFQIQKFGSRTFAPAVLDEVELYEGGVKVFGGNIVTINEKVESVDRQVYSVTVKDYSHLLDRRLVVEKYSSTPVVNIICEILNRYVNKNDRVEIADFEPSEIWTGGVADLVNFRTGTQGYKLTSVNNAIADANRYIFLDLQPTGFSTADTVEFDAYVDNHSNLSILRVDFGDNTFANYFTGFFQTQCTADGWTTCKMLKSSFSVSAGAPSWSTVRRVRVRVRSVAGTTVNVTCDNMQVLKPDVFTRDGASGASQAVEYMAFNYEYPSKCFQRLAELFQWQWYVDENKDINFFAKFDKPAAYSLSDTGAKYVYRSLEVNSNADQLRNAIYVRGSDYLGNLTADDLTHQIDGTNTIFKLGYKYNVYTCTLNLAAVPVGVDNIDKYTNNLGAKQTTTGGTALKVGDVAANTKVAQEVIVTKNGRRSSIRLRVRKVGAPVDNFQIQIFSDSGSDSPSAVNLSPIATLAGGAMTAAFTEKVFAITESVSNSLNLDVNVKYHVVIDRDGGLDAANYYEIDASETAEFQGYVNLYGGAVWTKALTAVYFTEGIDYDALFNNDEKIVTFAIAPAAGDTLSWVGLPFLPVFVLYKDNTSIATYGEYQYRIIDKSIKSKEGARQRALQEVLSWASAASEAKFKTYVSGLRAGQTITIESTIRGISQDFIINNVTASARTNGALEYEVNCLTTKTYGIIYWLQNQILKDSQDVEVSDDETEDKIEALADSFGFSTSYSYTLLVGKTWGITGVNDLVWNGGALDIWV